MRRGDTSRKEPYEVRKSRGSKPQACSRPQEENVAACESPQCVADRRHRAFGTGVSVRVYAASGKDQPRPRHSGRLVGRAYREEHLGRCRFQRRHGEVALHHREPCERARRERGIGFAAGQRPNPRADSWPFRHRGRTRHHRPYRQARVRAPRFLHRRIGENQDRQRPVHYAGNRDRRGRQ